MANPFNADLPTLVLMQLRIEPMLTNLSNYIILKLVSKQFFFYWGSKLNNSLFSQSIRFAREQDDEPNPNRICKPVLTVIYILNRNQN